MREIKLDLVCKNIHTGDIHHKKYFISELMLGVAKLFDIDNYEVIATRQYIGIKDKNGVEIYERDRLSMWYAPQSSCNGVVSFENGAFWFDTDEASPKRDLVSALTSYGNEIEVIGNIYETIKEGKE